MTNSQNGAARPTAEFVRPPLASHPEQWLHWVGTTVVNAAERDTRKAARVAPRGLFVFCGPCMIFAIARTAGSSAEHVPCAGP